MVGSRAVTEWNDGNQHHRSTLSLKVLLQINVTKDLLGALQYTCFYVTRSATEGVQENILTICILSLLLSIVSNDHTIMLP